MELFPLLSTAKDTSVHIPLELFVGLFLFTLTGLLGFFTWMTKKIIELGEIISKLQADQLNMKADIEILMEGKRRDRPTV